MRPTCLLLSALLVAACSPGPDGNASTGSSDTSTGDATTTAPTTAATTGATTSATTDPGTGESTATSTGAGTFDCGSVQCNLGELCFGYFSDACNDDEAGECVGVPDGCSTDDLCSPACATLCAHYTCPQMSFGCVAGYVCSSGCAQQSDCLLPGTACKAVSLDDGVSWDANRCVPTPPRPAAPGEPCATISDDAWTWDTCQPGAVCVSIDADTQQGVCALQCMLTDTPACDPCVTYGDEFAEEPVYFCPPTCDPLASTCAANEVCVPPENGAFVCVQDASDAGGASFEPCESINGCDPGLACLGVENSPMCDANAGGCCLPLCDLDAPVCPADLACVPWYAQGEAPDGLEHVGACGAPP